MNCITFAPRCKLRARFLWASSPLLSDLLWSASPVTLTKKQTGAGARVARIPQRPARSLSTSNSTELRKVGGPAVVALFPLECHSSFNALSVALALYINRLKATKFVNFSPLWGDA